MRVKYTPGPWYIDSINKGPNGREIFVSAINQPVCGGPWHMTKGDAQLISAAPDLLKACETALEYLEAFGIEKSEYVWAPLIQAIAKAKGEVK